MSEYEDDDIDNDDGVINIDLKNLPKDLQGTVKVSNKDLGGESDEEDDEEVDTFANSNHIQEKMKGEVTKLQLGMLFEYF